MISAMILTHRNINPVGKKWSDTLWSICHYCLNISNVLLLSYIHSYRINISYKILIDGRAFPKNFQPPFLIVSGKISWDITDAFFWKKFGNGRNLCILVDIYREIWYDSIRLMPFFVSFLDWNVILRKSDIRPKVACTRDGCRL